MERVLAALVALGFSASLLWASCPSDGAPASLDQLVDRVETEVLAFAFIGERNGFGPVKRFAVDLANRLAERGHDVGLYIEGFRVVCALDDAGCNRLATAFNGEVYRRLVDHSRAAVHPIDPVGSDDRASQMAGAIAAGRERFRVVLIGRTHVILAGNPEAEHTVFGGGSRYPDPGDVAEAFPREVGLTIGLETVDHVEGPYDLRVGGCGTDYVLYTERTGSY